MKLKLLLLILAFAGETQYVAQTDSNCTVPLTCREFDFYASALVREHSLSQDTAIMASQIMAQDKIIYQLERKAEEDSMVILETGEIADAYKSAFTKCSKDLKKAEKRAKRRGILAMSIGMGVVIETLLIILLL